VLATTWWAEWQQPELLMAQVWIHWYHYNDSFLQPILDAAESLFSHQPENQPLGDARKIRVIFPPVLAHMTSGELPIAFTSSRVKAKGIMRNGSL